MVGWGLTVSFQATCGFVLLVAVIALYMHDRRWGIVALFAVWFVVPGIRRVLGLMTGYLGNDPLSLAPFLATGAIAALEFARLRVPAGVRRLILLAGGGFLVGVPIGLLTSPRAAVFAFASYMVALSGVLLGLGDGTTARASALRRALLFGLAPIAAYAVLQRVLPLMPWDRAWVDAAGIDSLGVDSEGTVRVFGTLNSPGVLAGLLGLSLLCYLTVERVRPIVLAGAAVTAVALALTSGRAAWVALVVAGIAHVVVSGGRSAPRVFGAAALIAAATLALAPISPTARSVKDRFTSISNTQDASATERKASFSSTLPEAVSAPAGHGLGTSGLSTKLAGADPATQVPDNGYLGLLYQIGPVGFVLVMAAIAAMLGAAWNGARERAPGQEMRELLFAIMVYLLVLLSSGDHFFGVLGVILWFAGGQALGYRLRRRRAFAPQ